MAATESPPPTIEVASPAATALATASVPAAKGAISKTPMGPFQTIIFAEAIRPLYSATVSGPMSIPIQPSLMATFSVRTLAVGLKSSATT